MRYPLIPVVFLLLAACGGGGTPVQPNPPPPPPPAAGLPTSIAVLAGDGLEAEPGSALAARPSVVIKDAGGLPVPGVTVAFAVDSGGGSIAGGTALTGTDGIATAGVWTLGDDEGRNTVVAQAGVLLVRFGALARVQPVDLVSGTIPETGGVLTVTRPGSPLDGLRLEVPDSAFDAPVSITLHTSSSAGITLAEEAGVAQPAGISRFAGVSARAAASGTPAATPVITIVSNGPPAANGELILNIPIRPGITNPTVAVVDASGHIVAFLPIISSSPVSVTVTTRVMSTALLQQIGNIPQPVPSGARTLSIVVFPGPAATLPLSQLLPNPLRVLFGFRYHNFAFRDVATTYIARNDAGMMLGEYTGIWLSATGVLHGLYHTFDRAPGINPSETRGIMTTAGLSGDFYAMLGRYGSSWIVPYRAAAPSAYDRHLAQWLFYTIRYTQLPVPLLLTNGTVSRMVLVIEWDPASERFTIRDPALQGTTTLSFAGGVMAPYQDPYIPSISYTTPYFSYTMLAALWPRIHQVMSALPSATAPESYTSRFSVWGYESWDPMVSHTPRDVADTLFVVGDTTRIWALSNDLRFKATTTLRIPPGYGLQYADLFAQDPATQAWNITPVDGGQSIFLDLSAYSGGYARTFGMYFQQYENAALTARSWLGWKAIRVIRYGLSVAPVTGTSNTPVTLTPLNPLSSPQLPLDATFEWNFGDGTPLQTTIGKSPVVHTYTASGHYTAVLRVIHTGLNRMIARATAPVTIDVTGAPVWVVDFITVTSQGGAPPPDAAGTQGLQIVQGWVNTLLATPARGSIFLFQQPVPIGGGSYQGAWLEISPTAGSITTFDPSLATSYIKLASNEVGGIIGFLNAYTFTGTTSQGTVVGQGPIFRPTGTLGGQINAVFDQDTLSGTINLILLWFGGTRYTISLQFSATRI